VLLGITEFLYTNVHCTGFLRSVFVMGSVFAGSVEVGCIVKYFLRESFGVLRRKNVVVQEDERPNRQCSESHMPHFVTSVHGLEPSNPKFKLLYRAFPVHTTISSVW
jgi:hypothetical protein